MNDIMKNAAVIDETGDWIGIKGAYIGIFDADSIALFAYKPQGDRSLINWVADDGGPKPWHCHKESNAIDIADLLQWALDNGYPFELDTTIDDD